MGMDVLGKNPVTEIGDYFRNNISWWHPLAIYCCEVASDITQHCKYWHSNYGDGLNNALSLALADRLEAELATGRAHLYARTHHVEHREPCRLCESTGGHALPAIELELGMYVCLLR